MPTVVTIIAPLDAGSVEQCRADLRARADPHTDFDRGCLKCQPLFPFDAIATLHFCSFVILDAEAGFEPSLVFEATFDGARDDFLRELLRAAPQGFDTIYRHCKGYPAAGIATPELVLEYLERHDVGAHTFFSGAPGRSVIQIQEEDRIRSGMTRFLAKRRSAVTDAGGQMIDLFRFIRREFIHGQPDNRWAAEPAKLPWEINARRGLAFSAVVVVAGLACALGAAVSAVSGLNPKTLYAALMGLINTVGRRAADVGDSVTTLPWVGGFLHALLPALPILVGTTVIWAAIRSAELYLGALTKHPRDQSFYLRLPLQIAAILRAALVAFLAGSVLLVVITGMEHPAAATSKLGSILLSIVYLLIATMAFLALQYAATSLKQAVELKPLSPKKEQWRRAKLDLIYYAMAFNCVIGLLAIARQTPLVLGHDLADSLRGALSIGFVLLTCFVIGVLAGYCVASLIFLLIRQRERSERTEFDDPSALIRRAEINARKYAREEGGANTYQNHLASLTYVKPGLLRQGLLRLALFAINLLARLWFTRGELGGIHTILSARWVLIDGGRRLLFLDNFGGAWESYLNEFIDLPAVKGLNAIWTNTFVHAEKRRFGFPATEFLFWKGAQDERPFKAYVRQSQIETLVWFSAYPMLGVANINANTDLRQAFSRQLSPSEVDAVFQRL